MNQAICFSCLNVRQAKEDQRVILIIWLMQFKWPNKPFLINLLFFLLLIDMACSKFDFYLWRARYKAFCTKRCSVQDWGKSKWENFYWICEWEGRLLLNYYNLKIIRGQSSHSGSSFQGGMLLKLLLLKIPSSFCVNISHGIELTAYLGRVG